LTGDKYFFYTLDHEPAPSFVLKHTKILKNYVIMMNLFKNPNKRSNEQMQQQRISTRVFIILLSVSLIILLIYCRYKHIKLDCTAQSTN
jgi:hypothetical protein